MSLTAKPETMPTRVDIPPQFTRQTRHLRRKKPSVSAEARELVGALANDEGPGALVPDLGYTGVYKVRLRNRSAGRGKRGGFRVVYYEAVAKQVYLLLIYSKTEVDNIPNVEIQRVLSSVMRDRLP